jgi:predicted permease
MVWSRVRAAARRFAGLFRRAQDEQALADEMAFHVEMQVERNINAGMSSDDARRAALIAFGGRTQWRETALDAIRARHIENVGMDLRHAVRGMRHSAVFSLTAIVILGLGIGASVLVFRFADALLLEPLQASAPHQLLEVWNLNLAASSDLERHVPFSYPEYAFARGQAQSFTGLLAIDGDPGLLNWRTPAGAELVRAQFVSANAFSVLGVNAAVGRLLIPSDDTFGSGASPAVVSFSFWDRRLGRAANVVGQTMTLNGQRFSVVGVAPSGFTGALGGLAPEVWLPLASAAAVRHDPGLLQSHETAWLIVIGRLREGITRAQAATELKLLVSRYSRDTRTLERHTAAVFPATLVPGPYRPYVAAFVTLLQVVVLLVLTIASANSLNLFIARASARRPELATRAAVGASRGRLIQQMLTESTMLAVIAAVVGAASAIAVSPLLLRLLPAALPVQLELATSWRTAAFSAALAAAIGMALGWIPALRATSDLLTVIKRGHDRGPRRSRLRNTLVVLQVSVSFLLLVGSGLCVRSLAVARAVNPGFSMKNRVTVSLELKGLGYSPTRTRAFYSSLMTNVDRVPGVSGASIANYLPLETTSSSLSVATPERAAASSPRMVQYFDVGPRYFATLETPLVRGREFEASDDPRSSPVVVVNDAMARAVWGTADAVGRLIALRGPDDERYEEYRIIGVVPTGKYRSLGEPPHPIVYRAALQHGEPKATLVVHSTAPAAVTIAEVRKVIAALEPNLAVARSGPLSDQLSIALFPVRATSALLGAVGGLGLALALVGLAALIAYSVTCRQREIGIRLALGARVATIVLEIGNESLRLLATGLAIGCFAALLLARFLSGVLFGVSPTDVPTFAAVVALLVVTGSATTWLMARRAAAVDPMTALRQE